MLEQLVKRYVEFIQLDTPNKRDLVAQHHLGPKMKNGTIKIDGKERQRWRPTGANDFFETFGINLEEYKNFFAEVGGADAPEGPLVPGTVSPILVIRQTNKGNFKVHMFKVKGFFNKDLTRSWVDLQTWAEEIGDDKLADIVKNADKLSEIAKKNKEEAAIKLKAMMGIVEDE